MNCADFRSPADIRGQGDTQAGAGGRPIDRADDWLFDSTQREHNGVVGSLQMSPVGHVVALLKDDGDVLAPAEKAPSPGQDDAADGWITLRVGQRLEANPPPFRS